MAFFRDLSFITVRILKLMGDLIYDKYYPIGEAACRFMGIYFRSPAADNRIVISQFIKLASLVSFTFKFVASNYSTQCL